LKNPSLCCAQLAIINGKLAILRVIQIIKEIYSFFFFAIYFWIPHKKKKIKKNKKEKIQINGLIV
jgi:hypothetical protein